MTINSEKLQSELGITAESIDMNQLATSLIEAFQYHNDLAENTINAINSKSANSETNNQILWESFEMNNTLAYALRGLILSAATLER